MSLQYYRALMNQPSGNYIDDFIGSDECIVFDVFKRISTYSGDCMQIQRASDNSTQDIGFVGNFVDTAAIESFCTGTTGRLRRWYDQSPNAFSASSYSGYVENTSLTNMPYVYESGSLTEDSNTGVFMPRFDASDNINVSSAFGNYNIQTFSALSVYNMNVDLNANKAIWGFADGTGASDYITYLMADQGSDYDGRFFLRDTGQSPSTDSMSTINIDYGDTFLVSMHNTTSSRNLRRNAVEDDSSTTTFNGVVQSDNMILGRYRSLTNNHFTGYLGSTIFFPDTYNSSITDIETAINADFGVY